MEGNPKIAGAPPLAVGARLTPRKYAPPSTYVILPNSVVLGQTVRALLSRSAWKFDPLHPAFQGHSGRSRHFPRL